MSVLLAATLAPYDDSLIAAVAQAAGKIVVTRNTRHVERLVSDAWTRGVVAEAIVCQWTIVAASLAGARAGLSKHPRFHAHRATCDRGVLSGLESSDPATPSTMTVMCSNAGPSVLSNRTSWRCFGCNQHACRRWDRTNLLGYPLRRQMKTATSSGYRSDGSERPDLTRSFAPIVQAACGRSTQGSPHGLQAVALTLYAQDHRLQVAEVRMHPRRCLPKRRPPALGPPAQCPWYEEDTPQ